MKVSFVKEGAEASYQTVTAGVYQCALAGARVVQSKNSGNDYALLTWEVLDPNGKVITRVRDSLFLASEDNRATAKRTKELLEVLEIDIEEFGEDIAPQAFVDKLQDYLQTEYNVSIAVSEYNSTLRNEVAAFPKGEDAADGSSASYAEIAGAAEAAEADAHAAGGAEEDDEPDEEEDDNEPF